MKIETAVSSARAALQLSSPHAVPGESWCDRSDPAQKTAIAESFYVPSGSIEPTLLIGDSLLTPKYPYDYSAASRPIHM